jgi:glycerophosphoryl diester phosphodiesterase
MYPFLDAPKPIAFAHRGGAAGGVENSLVAFESAVDMGYRYLETDVHATADGTLVAFHDRTLDRVTDRSGVIAELPYDEVARARICGREPIPLLEDLLGTFPDVRFNIDVKAAGAIRPLIEVLRRTNAVDRVCIGAFSDRRISLVRKAFGPALCTILGPRGVARLRLGLPAGAGACVQVPIQYGALRVIDPRFVARAHRRGLDVHVWTVDHPAQMHWLLDIGVDGIMTDRIDTLRDVLVQRNQWHPFPD